MKSLTIVTVVLLLGVLGVGLFMPKPAFVSPMVNKQAPEFIVPDILGGEITNKDAKGKYVLLNFFASWCVSCLGEHPNILALKGHKNLTVYGIAWHDDKESLSQWLKKNGNPYDKVGLDDEGKLIIDFGISGVPESFLISPEGEIVFHQIGVLDKESIEKNILKIVN